MSQAIQLLGFIVGFISTSIFLVDSWRGDIELYSGKECIIIIIVILLSWSVFAWTTVFAGFVS